MTRGSEEALTQRIAALESEIARLRSGRAHATLGEIMEARSSAILEIVGNKSPNAIYVKDVQGRYVLVNDQFCRVAGLPRESILGKSIGDIFSRQVAEEHRANDRLVIGSGKTMSFAEFADFPDGRHEYESTKFPIVDETGMVVAVGGISTDITAQKDAETSLRESEEKFRLAFYSNPLAINLNRLSDGVYIDINEGFTRLMGYSQEEVIGKSSLDLGIWVDEADRERMVREFAASGRVENLRAKFRRKSGEIGIGVMSARTLRIAGETVVLSLTADVTAESELEERYRQAQKMEAVGRLAGGVAHDFNNLLIPILSYAEMLGETLDQGDERRGMTEEILKAGQRAANLARQILAFSRKQVLDMRPLDLNALIQDFQTMIVRLLAENIEVRLELSPEVGCVRADSMQIEQVLMNLAVNAGDAMPDGGVLAITTFVGALDEPARGKFADEPLPGRYAVMAVRDTGEGMAAETLAHIFEPFFTTKEEGKGTGLGLATVFGIVKQHQGHIEVSSRPGAGTTFKVYLPLCAETESARPRIPERAPSLKGSEIVLIVEDEPAVRKLVCGALERNGYVVMAAGNADEALRLSREWDPSTVPHLLLTDLIMPGTNGRELHAEMSARFPSLRAIFMSGYTDEVIVRHGLHEEGVALLLKPFTIHDLLARVRATLDGQGTR